MKNEPNQKNGIRMFRDLVAGAVLLTVSMLAFGADLGSAKSAGVVGEREDGYVGFVTESAADDVRTLVQGINDQRRAEYERIAAANGISREQVEALAGKKTIDMTASGEFVFVGGSWQKKP